MAQPKLTIDAVISGSPKHLPRCLLAFGLHKLGFKKEAYALMDPLIKLKINGNLVSMKKPLTLPKPKIHIDTRV